MKHKNLFNIIIAVFILVGFYVAPVSADSDNQSKQRWTYQDVFESGVTPFAIGHRGYGVNLGEVVSMPIENTDESIRRAFKEGIKIIEVDVVLSKDGIPVVKHDDYLSDYTCVNSLTFEELKERLHYISSLRQLLQVARSFSYKANSTRPSGIVNIEIKTPSPLCDPADTSVPALVNAVLNNVEQSKMSEQVVIESFSPEIVYLVSTQSEIPAILGVNFLQFLDPQTVELLTGLEVTLIDKEHDFNLQWAEIGVLFRLPGYQSMPQFFITLFGTQSYAASLDMLLLAMLESQYTGAAQVLVAQLHGFGMKTLVYTVNTPAEWMHFSSIGLDGIYTDNIPMGLELEGQ